MTYSCSGARLLSPLVLALATGCSVAAIDAPELQVFITGPGKGKVTTFMAEGIDCGSDCSQAYQRGLEVVLTATAAPGSVFSAWFGACTGRAGCRVKMDQDRTVTASFEITNVELRVTKSGMGGGTVTSTPAGIDCGIACTNPYPLNQNVTLSAAPDPGSRFTGWTGACTGTGPCQVAMGGNRTVDASFDIATSSVTVVRTGQGMGRVISVPAGIDCGATCGAEFRRASIVTLNATPIGDAQFNGWSGPCSGLGPCAITVGDPVTVRAEFIAATYRLSVMRTGTGSGSVVSTPAGIDCGNDCEEGFRRDTMVTLRATPAADSSFMGWSGACTGMSTCVVTMDRAKNVTAVFRSEATTLTVTKVGRGTGRVTSNPMGIDCGAACTAAFMRGTNVTLTAAADPGARFAGWTGACTGTGTCMVRLQNSATATATFELERRSLNVVRLGTGAGVVRSTPAGIDCGMDCAEDFEIGTQVMLTATPAAGAFFAGWTGPCSGMGPCTVSVAAASSVGAEFRSRYTFVPATIFAMGSPDMEQGRNADEGPVRPAITITSAFFLKTTEVTQNEWRNVMHTTPSAHAACGGECPVENVTFDDAVAYVNTLSDREGLDRCYAGSPGAWTFTGLGCTGYRLPTEAEWEAAARGGTTGAIPSCQRAACAGASTCAADPDLDQIGWHCGNSMGNPHPVAQKAANPFGLFDMHANVAEWVNDLYDASFYRTSTITADNTGPTGGTLRVIRGGAFDAFPRLARSAARGSLASSMRSGSVGLRPARSLYVRIDAGAFDMGSPPAEIARDPDEGPEHRVVISRAFFLRSTEMTQREWFALTGENPSSFPNCDRCPVEFVSWDQALGFTNLMSVRHRLPQCYEGDPGTRAFRGLTCPGYRLPTEAEWELAARGGSDLEFSTAPIVEGRTACDAPTLDPLAWYCGNSGSMTHPVAEKLPNRFGLHDILGNVAEWVHDAYDPGYYMTSPRVDPLGPPPNLQNTIRGGSFSETAAFLRVASRNTPQPPGPKPDVGFRPARTICARTGTAAVSRLGEPGPRSGGVAVRAGAEIIVLGGAGTATSAFGGRYDVPSGRWSPLATNGAPQGRFGFSADWTGQELFVFGGATMAAAASAVRGEGARFDPVRGVWTAIPASMGAPSARRDAASAWTGTEWFVWGGRNTSMNLGDGARYLPSTGVWLPVSASPLSARYGAAAVHVRGKIMVVGGKTSGTQLTNEFSLYDPFTDTWSPAAPAGTCSGTSRAFVLEPYVVVVSETGWCRYDPAAMAWSSVPPRPGSRALTGPDDAVVASTGGELLAYGGSGDPTDAVLDAYEPGANLWRDVFQRPGEPTRRASAAAFTGCGLFAWSGANAGGNGVILTP